MKKNFLVSISIVLLVVMTALLFTACTDTPDAKKLKNKLEDRGYSVEYYIADTSNTDDKNIQVLHAWNEESQSNDMVVYWYISENDAKEAFEEYSDMFADNEEFFVTRKGKAVVLCIEALLDLI